MWQSFPNIFHPSLRFDSKVIEAIQQFWAHPVITPLHQSLEQQLIDYLRTVPGIIDGHWRDFNRATIMHKFQSGLSLKQWFNTFGIHHIYLGDHHDRCIYAGYTGWLHQKELKRSIDEIPYKFKDFVE